VTSVPTAADVERFRSSVADCLGLRFEDTGLAMLAEVLERRVVASREAVEAYLDRLERGRLPRQEIQALAQEITVGETYFFRHMDQFRAFAEIVRPLRRLRVLSAGCASGEEAYSVAMMVREQVAERGMTEISITGVDVNSAALAKAARGSYSGWSLRETPPDMQRRWFLTMGREYTVAASIRASVRFEERNLADDEPGLWLPESYDVVFCRNVLMYLTPESARGVVARIRRALAPRGHLFLGHAETLRGLSLDFHLRNTHGTFYYERKDAGEHPAGADVVEGRRSPAPVPGKPDRAWAATWVETVERSTRRIQELSERSGASPTRSVEAAPESPAPGDMKQAVELLKSERFADALRVLGNPPRPSRDPDVLLLRAVLLTLSGQLEEAEIVCNDLCRLDELSAGAHYLLALCRDGARDAAGAEEHDRTAAYLDPGFAMPRLHLGLLARRSGDMRRARREIEHALDLLVREDPSRILFFGGGFSREALAQLCRAELVAIGGAR
jgi:chemotaxis protein methyltransferase CheR